MQKMIRINFGDVKKANERSASYKMLLFLFKKIIIPILKIKKCQQQNKNFFCIPIKKYCNKLTNMAMVSIHASKGKINKNAFSGISALYFFCSQLLVDFF